MMVHFHDTTITLFTMVSPRSLVTFTRRTILEPLHVLSVWRVPAHAHIASSNIRRPYKVDQHAVIEVQEYGEVDHGQRCRYWKVLHVSDRCCQTNLNEWMDHLLNHPFTRPTTNRKDNPKSQHRSPMKQSRKHRLSNINLDIHQQRRPIWSFIYLKVYWFCVVCYVVA